MALVETRGAPMPNTVAEAVQGSARLRASKAAARDGSVDERATLLSAAGHDHAV